MADSQPLKRAPTKRNDNVNTASPLPITADADESVAHSLGSNTPRKRVSQACDRCRSRKDKCDGARPVCSTCAALRTVCSYDPSTKKRGLPEGYVRGLEKLWGVSLREVKGLEDTLVELLNQNTTAVAWKDGGGVDGGSLVEAWRKSRLSKVLEELTSGLDLMEEKDKTTKRRRLDLTSNEEPTNSTKTSAGTSRTTDTSRHELATNVSHHIPDVPTAGIAQMSSEPSGSFVAKRSSSSLSIRKADVMPLPPNTWQLLDIYFSHVHCWFPIIEKRDLLKISYSHSSDNNDAWSREHGQKGNSAAMWAALTYSEHLRFVLVKQASENDEPVCTTGASYSHLMGLIPCEDGEFEMGHVQALLLMALIQMGNDRWSQAWLLIGKAVRVAIDLDLCHNEYSGKHSQTGPRTQVIEARHAPRHPGGLSRRRHVWLGCFALDTIIASRMRRRPHLRSEDIEELIEEDGLEEWDPWTDALGVRKIDASTRTPGRVLSTFNHFIRIMSVLNDITSTKKLSPEQLRRVHADFTQLNHGLPAPFAPLWGAKTRQVIDDQPILPHTYHLHLTYIATAAALQLRDPECILGGRSSTEIFASTIRQVAKLLKHESQHLGLLIVPPTFGYFLAVTGQCVLLDQDNIVDDYRYDILHSLLTMAKGWKTFESLQDMFRFLESTTDLTAEAQPPDKSHKMLAQGLGGSHIQSALNEHRRSQLLVDDEPQKFDSQFKPYSTKDLITHDSSTYAQGHVQISAPTGSMMFHGSDPNTAPQYTSSLLPDGRFMQPDPWPRDHSLTESSPRFEIDGDSMFNEFAALDALEWTNNWDQSLVNLGFTDPANMSQDFHTFCGEPDPLSSDSLVYQLIADTNTNSNQQHVQLYDSSVLEFPNQQVEASQILQALASARFPASEK